MVGLDHSGVMGMELMSAILLWTGIGWLADRWLGTGPWLLVVGGLIGNSAGIYLIWLRSARMEADERRATEARRLRPAAAAGQATPAAGQAPPAVGQSTPEASGASARPEGPLVEH